MNPRICKIAQDTDAWCDKYYFGDDLYKLEWEKKFAELIVQECISKIENAAYHDSCEDWEYGYNSGLNKAKELIVSHFEVEE